MFQLKLPDYLLVATYLALGTLLVRWLSRTVKSGREYFCAARSLPWWAVSLSLAGSAIPSGLLVGVLGSRFRTDRSLLNLDWIGCVPGLIVIGLVVLPRLWRAQVRTIPELLERRYSVSLRSMVSACWCIALTSLAACILTAIADWSGRPAGVPPWLMVTGILILSAAAVYHAGMAGVVYGDVVQFFLIVAGGLFLIAFAEVSDPAAPTRIASAAGSVGSLVAPSTDHVALPWPAVVLGLVCVAGPATWMTNQSFIQRALSVRSVYEAQASYVSAALLKNFVPWLFITPAAAVLAASSDPAVVHAHDAAGLLAAGLTGISRSLTLLILLAGAIGTLSTLLHSASTLLAVDLYERLLRPEADDRQILKIARFSVVMLAIWIGVLTGLLSLMPPDRFVWLAALIGLLQGPTLVLVISALYSRRLTNPAAVASFITGLFMAAIVFSVCRSNGATGPLPVVQSVLYANFWSVVVGGSCLFVVSYGAPSDQRQRHELLLGHAATEPQ